jgi:hypothetical protein
MREGPKGVVILEVGPNRTKFHVHRSFLIHYSEYFRKALTGPWKEAEDQSIPLHDVEVGPVNIFVHWLYYQKIPDRVSDWLRVYNGDNNDVDDSWTLDRAILKTVVFADRFLVTGLRRAANNYYVDESPMDTPPYGLVIYCFENLRQSSPILRFLADSQWRYWKPEFDEGDEDDKDGDLQLRSRHPHDFLVRVMIRYAESEPGAKKTLNLCDYHEHACEEEKTTCQAALDSGRRSRTYS